VAGLWRYACQAHPGAQAALSLTSNEPSVNRDMSTTPKGNLAERANTGLHEALLQHLPPSLTTDAPILDVGCGTGAWLTRLAERGFSNLTGIDYNTEQIELPAVRIECVDLNRADWTPLDRRFALITVIEVVEHIENLGLFFDRLEHHLEERGTILMTTPNIGSLAARLRFLLLNQLKQFDAIGDPTHLSPVVLATLPRLVERHGLRIAEYWGFPATGRTVTSRGWVNLLSRVLRRALPETVPGDNLCLKLVKVH
jgi:2-polyprenyl-3-methyl-5-hydroxy-6-metoxy-1,4-benzoquinol methylase